MNDYKLHDPPCISASIAHFITKCSIACNQKRTYLCPVQVSPQQVWHRGAHVFCSHEPVFLLPFSPNTLHVHISKKGCQMKQLELKSKMAVTITAN